MIRRIAPALCGGLLSIMIVGCEASKPSTSPVKGNVTLDGKPLPEGEIYFILPGQVPSIFPIKDGRFEGEAKQGTHRVEICAYRPRTDKDQLLDPSMTPPPENYLPEKYNTKSELTAQVEPAESKPFTFELQLK